MTFSSASVSAFDVEAVAAIAAGTAGLRLGGGGRAACWRVAGCMAGAALAAAGAFLITGEAGGGGPFWDALRASRPGLGRGDFCAPPAAGAQAGAPHPPPPGTPPTRP